MLYIRFWYSWHIPHQCLTLLVYDIVGISHSMSDIVCISHISVQHWWHTLHWFLVFLAYPTQCWSLLIHPTSMSDILDMSHSISDIVSMSHISADILDMSHINVWHCWYVPHKCLTLLACPTQCSDSVNMSHISVRHCSHVPHHCLTLLVCPAQCPTLLVYSTQCLTLLIYPT